MNILLYRMVKIVHIMNRILFCSKFEFIALKALKRLNFKFNLLKRFKLKSLNFNSAARHWKN